MSLKNLIFCICIEHPKSIIMRIGVVGKQKISSNFFAYIVKNILPTHNDRFSP